MSLLNFIAIPVSLATLAIAFKVFKLPKHDPRLIKHLLFRDTHPVVFGHRAGQFEAPENTLAAIETAHINGATAVEIDLDFTKDGVPIIFHDDEVDRVTNGNGKISDLSYGDLKKLNAAAKFNYVITKEGKKTVEFEKIPTLSEAVELCMKYNMTINLDVKSNAAKTAVALKSLLTAIPNATKFVLVTSFYPNIIYKVRRECPEYFTGLIWRYHYVSRTISGVPRYSWYLTPICDILDKLSEIIIHSWFPEFLGVSVVAMQKNHLSKRYVDQWRARDIEVIGWTVNHPTEKEFLLNNLRIPIITDSVLNSHDCPDQNT